MGAFSRSDGAAAIQQDYEQVLSLFPRVKERLNQLAGKLSGGEQQMVAIGARADGAAENPHDRRTLARPLADHGGHDFRCHQVGPGVGAHLADRRAGHSGRPRTSEPRAMCSIPVGSPTAARPPTCSRVTRFGLHTSVSNTSAMDSLAIDHFDAPCGTGASCYNPLYGMMFTGTSAGFAASGYDATASHRLRRQQLCTSTAPTNSTRANRPSMT